jgi:restriction system protein
MERLRLKLRRVDQSAGAATASERRQVVARRRRNAKKEEGALRMLLLFVLVAGALGSIPSHDWSLIANLVGRFAPVVGAAVLVVVLVIVIRTLLPAVGPLFDRLSERRALASLSRKAKTATEKHMTALVRRRRQLVQTDAYGHASLDAWNKEISHFMNTQVRPLLNEAEQSALDSHFVKVADIIETNVEEQTRSVMRDLVFSDDMGPREYEHLCADFLREAGWIARVTTHSRDFGVDVIAEKSQSRIVVQCKMYKKPVGIKAVQEIAAGKIHEQADCAVVVSNQRFTSAAIQVAATNDVLLLHHEDLRKIDVLVADGGRRRFRNMPGGYAAVCDNTILSSSKATEVPNVGSQDNRGCVRAGTPSTVPRRPRS